MKQAQITPMATMDHRQGSALLDAHAQTHPPDIGQTRCQHQTPQTLRIGQMTARQSNPPALLIREERLALEAFPIPRDRFLPEFEIGNQRERFLIAPVPTSHTPQGAEPGLREEDAFEGEALARFQVEPGQAKVLIAFPPDGVLGGTTDKLPALGHHGSEQADPIELPIAQENDRASLWQAGGDLFQQLLVESLAQRAFLAPDHDPP